MIKDFFQNKTNENKYNDFIECGAERQVGRRLLHRLQGVLCVQEMILLDKNKINAIGNIMIYLLNIDGSR